MVVTCPNGSGMRSAVKKLILKEKEFLSREIVSAIVAESDLQQKGQEPYFKAGLATPQKGVHFSEVSYNRERGALDSALVPTVRVVMPVFDETGSIFGMIVINANYSGMLRRAFEEHSPKDNTFVLNNSGDYMEYTSNKRL